MQETPIDHLEVNRSATDPVEAANALIAHLNKLAEEAGNAAVEALKKKQSKESK